jgi:hypothetical protein
MDERRALREFRADVAAPDPVIREEARAVLVAAAEPPRRRRLTRRRVVALALATAALAAAVALVASQIGEGDKDEAIAGLPNGPILHAVLDVPAEDLVAGPGRTHVVDVDLATGRTRKVQARSELWYDARLRRLHEVDSVNGAVVFEALETRRGTIDSLGSHDTEPATIYSGLGAFFEGYKRALRDKSVKVVGSGVVGGHRVRWLRFPPKPGRYADEVAVDARKATPLLIRHLCPGCVAPTTYRIVALEGVRSAEFPRPVRRDLHQVGGPKVVEENVSLRDAVSAFGGRAVWPGRTVGGLRLTAIQLSRVTVRLAPPGSGRAKRVRRTGLTFYYGGRLNRWGHVRTRPGEPFLTVAQAAAADVRFRGFNLDVVNGNVAFVSAGPSGLPALGSALMTWTDGASTFLQLRTRGGYVEIDSSSRGLALSAARALRPPP